MLEIRDFQSCFAWVFYTVIGLTLLSSELGADITVFGSTCPLVCRCITWPEMHVICSESVDDLLQLRLPQKTVHLNLQDNSIQSIPSYFFLDHGVVELVELNLSRNNISNINSLSFIGLNKLEYLDLSYNKILTFDSNSLMYNDKLTHIYLRGTGVPMPKNSSLIVSHSLKLLDVSDCQISSISTLVFSELPYLLVLNISRNPISRVDARILDNLTWLRELDISKTNVKCDSWLVPLADWGKSHRVRLTGYPCRNGHNDEAPAFRSPRKKSTTEGPEWPSPDYAVENSDEDEENEIVRTTMPVGQDEADFEFGMENESEITFWARLAAKVNWTFWLMLFGMFSLGVGVTILVGYACYNRCKKTEELPNELVSAGDDFQLIHSEVGYDRAIPDQPPSYSSLYSSRYQKVLPTPQVRYGQ